MQATGGRVSVAAGGAVRDLVTGLATSGALGEVLTSPGTGYSFVYHVELVLMFVTIIAIGPLVRSRFATPVQPSDKFGLAELPG